MANFRDRRPTYFSISKPTVVKSNISIPTQPQKLENNMSDNCMNQWDCDCDCKNQLDLDKLCVKKLKACWAKIKELEVGKFCAEELSSPKLCVDIAVARDAEFQTECVQSLNATNICSQNITATKVGISNLTANEVCVPGTLRAANLVNCGKYRASITYSAPITYTLGNNLVFDTILDDPNGNINLAVSSYTAPLTGYYVLTFKVNQQNLVPFSGTILGVPVANPEVYVNGNLARELYAPYLSFFNQQKTIVAGMVLLNAGDVITMKYNVLTMDQSSGVVQIPGTIDIQGNSTDFNSSIFMIHLLSVTCTEIPCAPSIPCVPCQPMTCVPCTPCKPCESNCEV